MFEKKLQDLVKDIRSFQQNKSALDGLISAELQSIKVELKQKDNRVKSNAVGKLTYLKMLGYDISWAAFHVIEVMSIHRFKYKRIGYLAATHIFTQNQELVLLCTNLLKKDLHSKHPVAIGTAVNCAANIMDRDLARDLLDDLVNMMTSSQSYVRKKAVLVMYKTFEKYPQGLRLVFAQLKKKLLDDDVSVVSCAVNVVCELARKRPKNYITLVPVFFTLLQNASNNWMVIKVVKLLGTLMSEEPRLAKKLIPPLCNIIQTTPAKSLVYECISTLTLANAHETMNGSNPSQSERVIDLCTGKLQTFLTDPDQNLKYLGLVGLSAMIQSNMGAVSKYRGVILKCLEDEDMTIRLRALDLLCGMITKWNSVEVVQKLIKHSASAECAYRDAVVERILCVCSRGRYEYVRDFGWYFTILMELLDGQGGSLGAQIGFQIVDICMRVPNMRELAVHEISQIITTGRMFHDYNTTDYGKSVVLMASAFVVGEYSNQLRQEHSFKKDFGHIEFGQLAKVTLLISTILSSRTAKLSPAVQGSFVHCAMKILTSVSIVKYESTTTTKKFMKTALALCSVFARSAHIEVQERAVTLFNCISIFENLKCGDALDASSNSVFLVKCLNDVFNEEIKAVNPKAQSAVPSPINFVLGDWIEIDEAHAHKITQKVVITEVDFSDFSERTGVLSSVAPKHGQSIWAEGRNVHGHDIFEETLAGGEPMSHSDSISHGILSVDDFHSHAEVGQRGYRTSRPSVADDDLMPGIGQGISQLPIDCSDSNGSDDLNLGDILLDRDELGLHREESSQPSLARKSNRRASKGLEGKSAERKKKKKKKKV